MDEFTMALLRAIQTAQDEYGIRQTRLRQSVQDYGGVRSDETAPLRASTLWRRQGGSSFRWRL